MANASKKVSGVVIGKGWEVAFRRCSFDGVGVVDSSSSVVVCESCHFENPGVSLTYDMLTVQNGYFLCLGCLFSNDDRAATDSQFVQVNGTNASFASISSVFQSPGGGHLPVRAVEVSLAKHITLIGSVLNAKQLQYEWANGSSQATFGVESFGGYNPAIPFAQRSTVGVLKSLTYAPMVSVDASQANGFILTVTNSTAFAIGAPARPPLGAYQTITFDIFNNSGSAIGPITWAGGAGG